MALYISLRLPRHAYTAFPFIKEDEEAGSKYFRRCLNPFLAGCVTLAVAVADAISNDENVCVKSIKGHSTGWPVGMSIP